MLGHTHRPIGGGSGRRDELYELGPGPHRSDDIAAAYGAKVESVAPLPNNLIRKGMIYSPAHGDTAFTVPPFHLFMRRILPRGCNYCVCLICSSSSATAA
jgi:hypothetical protein